MIRAGRLELKLSGTEGDATIVDGARPWRRILWEKASRVPCCNLVNAAWCTRESMEAHSPEDLHCYGPTMDEDCRYIREGLVETGPWLAVVHWDYALCDNLCRVFWTHCSTPAVAETEQDLADRGVPVRPTGRTS